MRRAAGLATALLLTAACATPPPATLPLPADAARAGALLRALDARADALRGVRGTARVRIEGQRGSSFARQLVALERPARLRVEVVGLLGQRIAVLATDGTDYQLWRAEGGELESGPVHPAILLEVAGLPLTPEQAVGLLLGAPRPPAAQSRAYALPEGGLAVATAAADEQGLARFEFDAEGRLRGYVREAADGAPIVEARWEDFRPSGEGEFAHRVELSFPAGGARAEVSWREVELNPVLPENVFRLRLPSREARASGGR